MNLSQLRNFLELAEKLNFRKTAENIFIAQPALSRQIKLLEDETGALLFKRNKRNVELTAAGIYFRNEADRLIKQLEKIVSKTGEIHRGEMGDDRLGFGVLGGLVRLVGGFVGFRFDGRSFSNSGQFVLATQLPMNVGSSALS